MMVQVEANSVEIAQLPKITKPSMGGEEIVRAKRFRKDVAAQPGLHLKGLESLSQEPSSNIPATPMSLDKVNFPAQELNVNLWHGKPLKSQGQRPPQLGNVAIHPQYRKTLIPDRLEGCLELGRRVRDSDQAI